MEKLEKSIFLTFDIDWASDEVLDHTVNLLSHQNIAATFFITHETPVIEKIRNNPLFELGIHPNFNPFLEGKTQKTPRQIIQDLKELVPEAISIRSHSLFQSSRIFNLFAEYGFKYDLNMFVPAWSNIILKPYLEYNHMMRVPYFWEDDIHCLAVENGTENDWQVKRFLTKQQLKVFDFHPIHVFLNTEKLERYTNARPFLQNKVELNSQVNTTHEGVQTFLQNLITKGNTQKFQFRKISELADLL